MQYADDDVAERDLSAVVERCERIGDWGGAVLIQRRGRPRSEVALSGTMVGMDVRGDDRLDANPATGCDINVLSDLELRIDDRTAALTASTEDVGRAARFRSKNLAEDHDGAPRGTSAGSRGCVSRMRTATTAPDASVRPATTPIATSWPRACATMPDNSAPNA
jgi:hypothetical protein